MTKGDCDLCGRWDGALAEGVCGECRERYCGESNTGTFRDVLADMQPDETLAGYAVRVKREWDAMAAHVERLRSACQLGVDMMTANECDLPKTFETMHDAIAETPAQSLAAVRAEAVESAVNYADDRNDGDIEQWGDLIEHYAQQLRNRSDDDGRKA